MSVSQNYKTVTFDTAELEQATAALFVRVRDLQKIIDGAPPGNYRDHVTAMCTASSRALSKVTQ